MLILKASVTEVITPFIIKYKTRAAGCGCCQLQVEHQRKFFLLLVGGEPWLGVSESPFQMQVKL